MIELEFDKLKIIVLTDKDKNRLIELVKLIQRYNSPLGKKYKIFFNSKKVREFEQNMDEYDKKLWELYKKYRRKIFKKRIIIKHS